MSTFAWHREHVIIVKIFPVMNIVRVAVHYLDEEK